MTWGDIASMLNSLIGFSQAFAADGSNSAPSSGIGGIGALIMFYICASRSRKEIGGWLLYYYIQMYIGVIITVTVFLFSFNNYRPSSWSGNTSLYLLFLLSLMPGLLLQPLQLIVAEKLRFSRNFQFVKYLRYVLWADLAFLAVSTIIDIGYFPSSIPFDVIGFLWPIIWLPYFYKSKRVRSVFETKDWGAQVAVTATP
jgi:hypothetical protein